MLGKKLGTILIRGQKHQKFGIQSSGAQKSIFSQEWE